MEHVGPRKTSPGQGVAIGRSSGTSAEDRAALAGQRGERGKMDGAGEASGPARPGQGSRSVLDGLSPGGLELGKEMPLSLRGQGGCLDRQRPTIPPQPSRSTAGGVSVAWPK